MSAAKRLVRQLAEYATAKPGARQNPSWCNFDVLEHPHVQVAGALWGDFFEVDQQGDDYVALLPVDADRLEEHRQRYPVIRRTDWLERDRHVEMEVPLGAGLPVAFLKSLIDEAHAIVWNKLNARGRLKIALADMPYDEPGLMDRLIEIHGLKKLRTAIRKLARPAILLVTTKSTEAKIPPGATKIGGRPDLPEECDWPAYRDGRPLAFLAQINLADVAKAGTPIKGLPSSGLLSVFSVWGWTEDGDFDPQTPEDGTEQRQEEAGWTVVLSTPLRTKLERRKTPRGVNAFKSAAVQLTPILSLPNHRSEPPLAALGWTDEEYESFDQMQSDYRSVQMGRWLKYSDSQASHHLLGGYALFQQAFPEELPDKGLAMFLQIGTDAHAGMAWGDGGELTFYADARVMARGRVQRVWGTCQGG
jgi:uncharacterized protein YwqG